MSDPDFEDITHVITGVKPFKPRKPSKSNWLRIVIPILVVAVMAIFVTISVLVVYGVACIVYFILSIYRQVKSKRFSFTRTMKDTFAGPALLISRIFEYVFSFIFGKKTKKKKKKK